MTEQPNDSYALGRADEGFGSFFRYHGWLSPGVRLFRKISFRGKALWVSAAFIIPLVVLLGLLWRNAQELLDSTRAELVGVRYTDAALDLIAEAQNRRRAATLQAPDLDDTRAKVNAAFKMRLPLEVGVHSPIIKRQICAAPPASVVRTASG